MTNYEPFDEQMEKIINEHSRNYFNAYNKAYQSTHLELLQQGKKFGVEIVYFIALKNCPDSFTKKEITNLAQAVLDENLNSGLIKIIDADKGIYESAFVNNNQNEIEENEQDK